MDACDAPSPPSLMKGPLAAPTALRLQPRG